MKEFNFENKPLEIKVDGTIYSIDADNIEIMKEFTAFSEDVEKLGAQIKKNGAGTELICKLCERCMTAAEKILGEGAAVKIFGDTVNFVKCCKFSRFLSEAFIEYFNETARELTE